MVKLTESAVYIRTKSSIENVKKLNLWGCGVDDISICSKMPLLEILSLSLNEVKSLEGLQNCKNLKELYLRKNKIESIDELEYLKDLPNLRILWIDENPFVAEIGADYRKKIVKILPQITKLDDKNVTSSDHLPIDDCVAECDMNTSIYSSNQSIKSTQNNSGQINKSIYIPSTSGAQIIDRIIQPQMLHFGDTSDEEKSGKISIDMPGIPLTKENTSIYLSSDLAPNHNLMTQSMYCATLAEEPSSGDGDEEWNDFSFEEDWKPSNQFFNSQHRMYQSVHEGFENLHESRKPIYGRSVSMPRRRIKSRTNSTSPARENRLKKIMSAVSVLLDELDVDGLRKVVDEAQKRIKKQR